MAAVALDRASATRAFPKAGQQPSESDKRGQPTRLDVARLPAQITMARNRRVRMQDIGVKIKPAWPASPVPDPVAGFVGCLYCLQTHVATSYTPTCQYLF